AWFGFCALYFMIRGMETRRMYVRIVTWALGCGSLYVVALTVSRGTLLAVGLAALVALRRFLKRGLLPILLFVLSIWVIYQSGLFDRAGTSYAERAGEETGRFLVWPLAFERFLGSPLVGAGASNAATYVPERGKEITPHNSFLFIALASGTVPFLFFVAYIALSALGFGSSLLGGLPQTPFLLPLSLFTFVTIL